MRAIHTKLFRDMAHMGGAVFTIALVVALGVCAFVALRGTYLSMIGTRDAYYSKERFGDVFAHFERAPNTLIDRIEALPGVARVYPRVVGDARVPMPDLDEPAQAVVLSIPVDHEPQLNGIVLIEGRKPSAAHDDEALLVEMFAKRHNVKPGDALKVIMEGRERTIRVVGVAMSPEFVMSAAKGAAAPTPERFAVLWMPRTAVEGAYDMRGAFNDVVLDLAPEANEDAVVAELDKLLEPHGGLGAQTRKYQVSNYFLTQDMQMLGMLATLGPVIFLAVAAFLLNVVLSRLVELDRPQIATLKALGYTSWEVGLHYLQLTLLISTSGGLVGLMAGSPVGGLLTQLYVKFYRMPQLAYRMAPELASTALLVSVIAGVVGAALAVRRVMRLAPAEAMRPVAPPNYRQSGWSRALLALLTPSARMVGREILRRPARVMMGVLGIMAGTGIVVIGQFFVGSMSFLVNEYLQKSQSETLFVTFIKPVPEAAVHALHTMPGVRDVQWQSVLQVRARVGHRDRIVSLIGHPLRHDMRPLLMSDGTTVPFHRGDVLLTETLARILEVRPGSTVRIEPMQGERTPRSVVVTGTLSELMGMFIHLPSDEMFALLGQAPSATSATLRVDSDKVTLAQAKINDMRTVSSVMRKDLMISEFRHQTGDSVGGFAMFMTLFAVGIAVAVVYNNARIALSMRARELASLRVLGFTRAEISSILIGELGVQVVLGIPSGLWFGSVLSHAMIAANDPETFRFPAVMTHYTLAFAALVTTSAAVGSALLVRRKLDKLDLIEVLKTRE